MNKFAFGFLGLLLLLVPGVANAQRYIATQTYSAKFLCGFASGSESALGVVLGHYNTTINVQATVNRTPVAYRVTPTRSNLEVSNGTVSGFSSRFDLDRDGAFAIVCGNIKSLLGVQGSEGFVEGFVTIYTNAALNVMDVLTAENLSDVSTGITAMQVLQILALKLGTNFGVTPAD